MPNIITLFLRHLLICSVAITINGCANKVVTSKDNQTLQADHGWLALPVQTPNKSVRFEFSRGLTDYNSPTFPFGDHLSLIQLPVGSYRISGMNINHMRFTFNNQMARENFFFRIEPDQINYMGHLRFDGNTLSVTPNLAGAVVNMALNYEDLLRRYEVKYTHENAYK